MSNTMNKDIAEKMANIVGPTDPKEDQEAREALITARVSMLLNHSFFGSMATRLELVNADNWLPTAAVDGRRFYYNSRFILMLDPKELEFLVGHEVLHCCYDHLGRRGSRDPQLWNIANDYAVNADLKRSSVGKMITTVPCLYETKYDGMISELIYDDLYENAEKIDINDLLEQLLDEHLDGQQEGNGNGDGNGDGKGSGPAPLTEEEKAQIRDEIKEAMINAAEQAGAGNVPGGVKRLIQDLTEPKMNWRELLRQHLESTIKTDFSWMRPSRRGWHTDAVMPGMVNGQQIDIAVAIDASGSINEQMLLDFLGEIKGITEEFDQFKVHVFTFDTSVYNSKLYTSDNLEDIEDYEIDGGGGTDFDVIFKHMKEEEIEPERLVVFTDGYPWGSWGDENYCDTLWIIHEDESIKAPFGTTVVYDRHID